MCAMTRRLVLPSSGSERPRDGPRLQFADRTERILTRAPARPELDAIGAHQTMISTGELRKGVTIELDNELWQILDYHHIKMGRGSAQVRITLRNVRRGQTIERSFQAGTKWPRAQLDRRPVQFLYRDGDDFHFMENETYDQFAIGAEQLEDAVHYLRDGMTVDR